MKRNDFLITTLAAAAALAFSLQPLSAQTETTATIKKWADSTQLIPVAVTGFSGEVAAVLKFDLEVMGCKVVTEDAASYTVQGTANGNVQGYLFYAKSKTQLLGKSYAGGTLRVQAHTFADDIIEAITPFPGIARTKMTFKLDKGTTSEIVIADFDGFGAQQVTHDNSIVAAPCWVPGQRVLFYNSYKSGFPDIYSHDLGSGTRKVIARYSGSNISPAVSPDGRRVAMILSKGGSPNVYVANADGSGLRQLTTSKEGESSPCWSPDSSTVCFVSRSGGRAAIYTVPASGGALKRVMTSGAINATEPDWSPDGKWIAFTAQMGGFQICVVPAGGGEAKMLVAGSDPSWAPNSRTLLFTRSAGRGLRGLSLLDVLTKQVKDCHSVPGSSSQPSWAK